VQLTFGPLAVNSNGIAVTVTVGLTPTLEALISSAVTNWTAALARIEAKIDAAAVQETKLMADIDDLTSAVNDSLAATAAGLSAIQGENGNIDAAITKLAAMVPTSDPAVQAEITALKSATATQRTATQSIIDENAKLATALSLPPAAPGGPPAS
jgi:ABC-type transporter Mla subunit MlaD